MATRQESGEPVFNKIAFFYIVVEDESSPQVNNDNHLLALAEETRSALFMDIEKQTRQTLGEGYRVEDFDLKEGSLIISFATASSAFFDTAAGRLLLDFSRYEALVKSLTLLASQLHGVVKRFFRRTGPRVTTNVTWQPSPTVSSAVSASAASPNSSKFDANRLLLIYLVGSHASLTALIIWLVIRARWLLDR